MIPSVSLAIILGDTRSHTQYMHLLLAANSYVRLAFIFARFAIYSSRKPALLSGIMKDLDCFVRLLDKEEGLNNVGCPNVKICIKIVVPFRRASLLQALFRVKRSCLLVHWSCQLKQPLGLSTIGLVAKRFA